jgi:hypothetical protein
MIQGQYAPAQYGEDSPTGHPLQQNIWSSIQQNADQKAINCRQAIDITYWALVLLAMGTKRRQLQTLYAGTTNSNRHKITLIVIILALHLYMVDGAITDSVKRTILENAAQIKILDCFTAFQQRPQLDGYDSEETEVPIPQARAISNTTRIRGDVLMPTENI